MPFEFGKVCSLLSDLESLKSRDPPLLPAVLKDRTKRVVEGWFRTHRRIIDASDTNGVALLSTLFPEKRTDRVYGLQEARLSKVIGRYLGLNSVRRSVLEEWRIPGKGDLGACVERILLVVDCEPRPGGVVTVEEIDRALQQLAARNVFSGPLVRSSALNDNSNDLLDAIFRRLRSNEAKWLTRLILKDFAPVVLDHDLVLSSFHFLLPKLLRFQDDLAHAVGLLRGQFKSYHANPDVQSRKIFSEHAVSSLRPRLGVKIGRPPFAKARSIDQCVKMAQLHGSRCSVERKYDGEYCEIQIDLEKGDDCIQIFSKSGKDSTADRRGVHETLRRALRIGSPDCKFKKRCIVLAELVVYSDEEQRILAFHKIRKHVSRSGVMLGTMKDSQAHPHEHLMLVFFDILLLDDEMLLAKPYLNRREALGRVVQKRHGRAITSQRMNIDFSDPQATMKLREQFAMAMAHRLEGLILKPAESPFIPFGGDDVGQSEAAFIKLKKDYMQVLGEERDVVDFAVIGASYDPKLALKIGVKGIQFTTFYLGCIRNPEGVRFDRKPEYEVVGSVSADYCIPKSELKALNDYGRFYGMAAARKGNRLKDPQHFDVTFDSECTRLSTIFREPCVVEVLGSGFDKDSNKNYWMLRHPRVLKVHLDRTWQDAATFTGLQDLAKAAISAPPEGDSQEAARLIGKLVNRAERIVAEEESDRRRAMTTPRTVSTVSPKKIRQRKETPESSPLERRKAQLASIPLNLVRVDTTEWNIPMAASVHKWSDPRILRERKDGSNSLPTPPSSSEVDESNDTNAKPFSIIAGNKKRPRSSENQTPAHSPPTKLQCVASSDCPPSRRVNLAASTPPSSRTDDTALKSSSTGTRQKSDHDPFITTSISRHHLLTKAVLMVTPCVAETPWLEEYRLPECGCTIIENFEYLVRQTAISESQVNFTVPESQAFPGMIKIVLVETKRTDHVRKQIEKVCELGIRDRLLWFDWRVCTELCFPQGRSDEGKDQRGGCAVDSSNAHDLRERVDLNTLQKHYVGSTYWDKLKDKVTTKTATRERLKIEWFVSMT